MPFHVKPDPELASWLMTRGMKEAVDGFVIGDDQMEMLERHRAQAALFRHLGPQSRENWALWTTYTHPGHGNRPKRSDVVSIDTREPAAISDLPPAPAPQQTQVVTQTVVYTVTLRWREWAGVALVAAAAEAVFHLLVR